MIFSHSFFRNKSNCPKVWISDQAQQIVGLDLDPNCLHRLFPGRINPLLACKEWNSIGFVCIVVFPMAYKVQLFPGHRGPNFIIQPGSVWSWKLAAWFVTCNRDLLTESWDKRGALLGIQSSLDCSKLWGLF